MLFELLQKCTFVLVSKLVKKAIACIQRKLKVKVKSDNRTFWRTSFRIQPFRNALHSEHIEMQIQHFSGNYSKRAFYQLKSAR